MPHQCTDCGRQFDDGSKEMLSGCPECGGNKFQFLPSGQAGETEPDPPGTGVGTETGTDRSVARTVGNAATAVRDLVGGSSDHTPRDPGIEESDDTVGSTAERSQTPETPSTAESKPSPANAASQPSRSEQTVASMAETEDEAQASARSDVISPDELPPSPQESSWPDEAPASQESEETERPDLSELRAELNEQFESIKVLEPGQYELNLMELFDREEYIVALQEDGKYTVQVPEDWKK